MALHCHHGAASGALSNLHKEGKVARLKDQRGGSAIYVLPHAVNERPVARYGRIRPPEGMSLEEFERALQEARDEATQNALFRLEVTEIQSLREGRLASGRQIAEVATAMLREMPNPVVSHHQTCWQTHPRCAVTILLRSADRIVRENSVGI